MSATQARPSVNIEDFKTWCRDCAPAARAVLMARVHAQMERERVDAYIRPIFDTYHFEVTPRWRERLDRPARITDPKDLYLCEDEPMLRAYYADCDDAHRTHGFTGPKGHCPALVAENLVMAVERELINLAAPLFGIEDVYGDNRARYLELLIGACIKAEQETR